MSGIGDAIEDVRARIARACDRSGRDVSEVTLIAVTKTVGLERIQEAASFGVCDFGENYVQEARQKIEDFNQGIHWHMIGHIQTNKIKYIQRLFSFVHSVDRIDVLEGLDSYGKEIKILYEVNLSGEASKYGTALEGLRPMIEKAASLQHVRPVGLMTMPPYAENPEEVRGIFQRLRKVLQEVNREYSLAMTELSMGMSSDFEVAIEEGATMVRVGTAIFGGRV